MNRPRSARPASTRQATNRSTGTSASTFKFSQHMLADLGEEIEQQSTEKKYIKDQITKLNKDILLTNKEAS
jgi:hypothetical protein